MLYIILSILYIIIGILVAKLTNKVIYHHPIDDGFMFTVCIICWPIMLSILIIGTIYDWVVYNK